MQTVSHLLRQKGNQFFWVAPTDSVRKAIELMATHHVGALLVMAPGPSPEAPPVSLVGVISERDYARKVSLKKRSPEERANRAARALYRRLTRPAAPVL